MAGVDTNPINVNSPIMSRECKPEQERVALGDGRQLFFSINIFIETASEYFHRNCFYVMLSQTSNLRPGFT